MMWGFNLNWWQKPYRRLQQHQYEISDEEYEALKRAQTEPVEPTESIKRGAEQLRRLYGR